MLLANTRAGTAEPVGGRKYDIMNIWTVCLTVLAAAAVLMGLTRLLWAGAPDAVVRTLGVVLLITLPVFVFTTVRLAMKRQS